MEQIAVFGGSFDPVHNGHLKIIEAVQKQLNPDRFLLIPCGNPPHREPLVASSVERLQMLHLATQGMPSVEIDCRELESEEASYSYLTLRALQRENPNSQLLLVMGWDSLVSLTSWCRWQEVLASACLVVVRRAGDKRVPPVELGVEVLSAAEGKIASGTVVQLEFEEVSISSTQVRLALKQGRSIEDYLCPAVCNYIEAHNIYTG